jgi:hypothetical protein
MVKSPIAAIAMRFLSGIRQIRQIRQANIKEQI